MSFGSLLEYLKYFGPFLVKWDEYENDEKLLARFFLEQQKQLEKNIKRKEALERAKEQHSIFAPIGSMNATPNKSDKKDQSEKINDNVTNNNNSPTEENNHFYSNLPEPPPYKRNKSGIEPEICQVNSGCGMVSDVQYLNFIDQNETEEVKN